ncbi:uncharacterized protein LOC121861112 [Homarus americanus]|uniref:uncharacterized protein LOC121861112 n=1 Tax=Homarus americanus TaxID=6706 RepID=UPI001C460C19|nr:uncharacterized protein LOC121861112 [Homarus americanus]
MSIPGTSGAAPAADDAAVLSTVARPAFIGSDLELWLLQLSSYFMACRITASAMKYHRAMSKLPPTVNMEVRDILTAPPAETPFQKLCLALRARLGTSSRQRMQQLLWGEFLNDRKPSQLLRSLRHLLSTTGTTSEDLIFRPLFLQRLPSNVQAGLSTF